MSPDELTRRMRSALAEERDGIARLDHVLVTRASRAKEEILVELLALTPEERSPLISTLDALGDELQQNLILLMHAQVHLHAAKSGLRATKLSPRSPQSAIAQVKLGRVPRIVTRTNADGALVVRAIYPRTVPPCATLPPSEC